MKPSLRYQHASEDLWKKYQENIINYDQLIASLEQLRLNELRHYSDFPINFEQRADNAIWKYEHKRREERSKEERIKSLTSLELYKIEIPQIIRRYRKEADHYRNIANWLQITIIIGSVLVTSATSAAGFEFGGVFRWIAPVISIVVAISAGIVGYFKFRERSFNLQQTADNIEQDYNALELGIGYYKGMKTNEALVLFAERVELLREEQKKRQQQLEQPTDTKHVQYQL